MMDKTDRGLIIALFILVLILGISISAAYTMYKADTLTTRIEALEKTKQPFDSDKIAVKE